MLWLLVVLAAGGLVYLVRIAPVGASYKAKTLCSALFVSGRELDSERSPEVSAESYRILRLFPARIDRERREVTCALLGLVRERSAAYRPGLGAALLAGTPREALRPDSLAAACSAGDPSKAWPEGEAAAPAAVGKLARTLEEAFCEPDRSKPRRTRAIVVVKGGLLAAERYAEGFGPATPLCGWSMTKSVLHAVAGLAVGEGRLSTDRRDLLPEWRGDARAGISVEDLLRMQSGLEFAEVYADPLSDVNRMLWAEPSAAAYAASRPPRHPPGSFWAYASGTSNILGRVVRRAVESAGEDWASFPSRALFGPLGMSTAVLETDAAGDFVFSSFLQASPRDWARFGLLYAQDGVWGGARLLPEGWVAHGSRPAACAPDGRYGAHWWLKLPAAMGGESKAAARLPPDAFHALGHEGQALTVIPSRKLVVLRMGLSILVDAWDHAAFLSDLLDSV